jgi:hypothetical protein
MSDHGYATSTSSVTEAVRQATPKRVATKNPFEPAPRKASQSRRDETVFTFDPPSAVFAGPHEQAIAIRNTTAEPQTLDGWHLVGDVGAFETEFLGQRSVVLQPGQSLWFRVRFTGDGARAQAAALIVSSTFGDTPARLNLLGTQPGQAAREGCASVPISAVSPEGRPNSIHSAMRSVQGAWDSVRHVQESGVRTIANVVQQDLPKATPAWKTKLDGILAHGLSQVIGAVGLYLGGGLALSTWNMLEGMKLGRTEAAEGAKSVANLTLKVHEQVTGSYGRSALKMATQAVREKIESSLAAADVSTAMKAAFFEGQTEALSRAHADAVTTLNNAEGDFAALEAAHPGLGFAALEAYRDHLSCREAGIAVMQRNATLGMWMALLAQLDLGTHEPESWEGAKRGAALENNLYNATDARHRMRDLARGVLELRVVWDYDRMRSRPIYELQHARMSDVHVGLKKFLLEAPLGDFTMPMIVHGKVKHDAVVGTRGGGQLRIGRNEGGAISLGAEPKTKGAEMLELLGNGDAFAGARELMAHVDRMALTEVE